jgi:hypothetical protein
MMQVDDHVIVIQPIGPGGLYGGGPVRAGSNRAPLTAEQTAALLERDRRAELARLFWDRIMLLIKDVVLLCLAIERLATYNGTDINNYSHYIVIAQTVLMALTIVAVFYAMCYKIASYNLTNYKEYVGLRLVINVAKFVNFVLMQVVYFRFSDKSGHFSKLILAFIILGYIFYLCGWFVSCLGQCITGALIICAFISCRICCPRMLYSAINALHLIPSTHTGLKPSELAKLTTVKYNPDLGIDAEHLTCAICSEDYVNDDELTKLNCNHYYHRTCSDKWLTINKTCPMCRQTVTFDE